jgi:hypothetical protein
VHYLEHLRDWLISVKRQREWMDCNGRSMNPG